MDKNIKFLITAKNFFYLSMKLFTVFLAIAPFFASAQIPDQPESSYSRRCSSGYKKSGDDCVSIFSDTPGGKQPANSYIAGSNWYCANGYKKSGNSCVSIYPGMPTGQSHSSQLGNYRQQAMPKTGSPISGGLPPLRSNN